MDTQAPPEPHSPESPPMAPAVPPRALMLPDGDRLLSIDAVAELLGYKSTAGVRTLICRGLLNVSARGARRRAYFRERDVLEMMTKRQELTISLGVTQRPRAKRARRSPGSPKTAAPMKSIRELQRQRRRERLLAAQRAALSRRGL